MRPLHRTCAVYLLANQRKTVLYVGATSDLERRVRQHRAGETPGFVARFGATRLVWYEATCDIRVAIAREKQLKAGSRARKVALIERLNPTWRDLSEDWVGLSKAAGLPRPP